MKLREIRVGDHSSVWLSADRAVYGNDQRPSAWPIECVDYFYRSLQIHAKDSRVLA
jgi:hypothetical protein